MKKIFLIFSLFFPLLYVNSEDILKEDNLTSLSLQAEALSEAQDYTAANQIYEKLLNLSLPTWQKERVLYNLGTLRLAQQHPIEALDFFKKIHPTNLSLPSFGGRLFLNEGIAYLQYAQSIPLNLTSALDQRAIFIEESLKAFDQAQQLECLEQKEESSPVCEASLLLNQWKETARLQLNNIFQHKRQNWMVDASIESLTSFLYKKMQDWLDHLKRFQEHPSHSLISYFQQQAKSFIPLWNALQEKEFSASQKTIFENSLASYSNALQHFNPPDLSSVIKEWKHSIEILEPITFQKNQHIQYVGLNYSELLLQENLTISSLKELLKHIQTLNVEKTLSSALEQTQSFLKSSLEALQSQHLEQAQFYLIAGYNLFHALLQSKASTPATILQQTLNRSKSMLQLFFLAEAMPKDTLAQTNEILKKQQKNVLIQVIPFISIVLKEQDKRFHQTTDVKSRCQQTPWDQAIPLYDRGFRLTQSIEKQFDQTTLDFLAIITTQIQAIKNWEQALNLILHPPQESAASTQQKWRHTFRQIQEMYLEDQPEPEETTKELHAW